MTTATITHIEVYAVAVLPRDVIYDPNSGSEFKVINREMAMLPSGKRVICYTTDNGPLARLTTELVTINRR